MATLYARIQQFYKRDRFRFKPYHKNEMGKRLVALWRCLHPGAAPLPTTESIEDAGTFWVSQYPDEFADMIDQLIRNYHQEILQNAKEARIKRATSPPPSPQKKLPPPPPVIKTRKRIPVKNIPAWKSK